MYCISCKSKGIKSAQNFSKIQRAGTIVVVSSSKEQPKMNEDSRRAGSMDDLREKSGFRG